MQVNKNSVMKYLIKKETKFLKHSITKRSLVTGRKVFSEGKRGRFFGKKTL